MNLLPLACSRFASLALASFTMAGGLVIGCGGDDVEPDFSPAAQTYARHVGKNYDDALAKATALQTAINAFVAAPSQATLDAAKVAWTESRPVYELTEPFRFYDGPVDAPMTGPEGAINGWPLDENYVDYTSDMPTAGIINHPTEFPMLTSAVLAELNEKGGEKNLATGYHAIEFLLWGQDLNEAGREQLPGARPYTDYVAGTTGTATNQARRGQYLKAVTDLLIEDLTTVATAWRPGVAGNYADTFVKDPKAAVSKMLTGLGSLAGGELSRERMNNAYTTKDQEEEHSCFSDTTHLDVLYAAIGIENVYLGRYETDDAAGLDAVVAAKNATLDAKVKAGLATMVIAMRAIPKPFDQAVQGPDTAPGRVAVKAAIDATRAVADLVVEVAQALGIKDLNIDNSLTPPKD